MQGLQPGISSGKVPSSLTLPAALIPGVAFMDVPSPAVVSPVFIIGGNLQIPESGNIKTAFTLRDHLKFPSDREFKNQSAPITRSILCLEEEQMKKRTQLHSRPVRRRRSANSNKQSALSANAQMCK
jgi:hypothetical protein